MTSNTDKNNRDKNVLNPQEIVDQASSIVINPNSPIYKDLQNAVQEVVGRLTEKYTLSNKKFKNE